MANIHYRRCFVDLGLSAAHSKVLILLQEKTQMNFDN